MQSTSVFLDITKVADFRWKNADVSITQGVFHVIYIFFGYSKLHQVHSCIIVGYVWQNWGRGWSFLPPHPWAALKILIMSRVNCEENFDNKKVRPVSWKIRGSSRWTKIFYKNVLTQRHYKI